MFLSGIRNGIATSSSSCHSIVYKVNKEDLEVDNSTYGWNWFICDTKETKLRYCLTALLSCSGSENYDALVNGIDWGWFSEAMDYVAGLFDIDRVKLLNIVKDIYLEEAYIDHASRPYINTQNYAEVFEQYKTVIECDDLAIVGGNDNGGDFPEDRYALYVCGTDESNMRSYTNIYQVIKNSYQDNRIFSLMSASGNKIYLTDQKAIDFSKLETYSPELFDIKITDYCYKGCEWCYQESSKEGKHCTLESVNVLYEALAIIKPFEIVLGGGEPTDHPYYEEIISKFKKVCTFLSVTTKDNFGVHALIDNPEVSKIGFSISNMEEYNELIHEAENLDHLYKKVTLHIIPALWSEEELKKLFSVNEFMPVLLLGFKPNSRTDLVELAEKKKLEAKLVDFCLGSVAKNIAISMDSTLVLNPEVVKVLNKFKIDPRLYTSYKEGVTSKYVDLVEGDIKTASYDKVVLAKLEQMNNKNYDHLVKVYQEPF
jgi:organic radical activating enzyme